MVGDGWIRPNRLSPSTPPVISRAENNRIMDEQRKKVEDASKDERQRICDNYQRRGGLLPKLHKKIAEKSNARKKGTTSLGEMATPSQPLRRSLRNSSGKSTMSSLSSVKSSQPLLDDTPTPKTITFDDDIMERGFISMNKKNKPSRLSNITEEEGDKEDEQETRSVARESPLSAISSLRSRSPSAQCCVGFLCLRKDNVFLPSDDSLDIEYTRCIECTLRAHIQCCEQFYFQKPTRDGPLLSTSLSVPARKRLKEVPDNEKEGVMFCLKCRVTMEGRQSKKKHAKNKSAVKKVDKEGSAPKKKKPLAILPDWIKLELRRAAGFYARHLIFQGKAAKLEDCKTNTGKLFYGNPAEKKKGIINMLVDGDEPFKDLYEEYETDNGIERILKPWLCGTNSMTHYIPGVHFTAESLSLVGDRQVSGRTLWENSGDTVKIGKKAISFIPVY